jgi:hypothetical protein
MALLHKLRQHKVGEVGQWQAFMRDEQGTIGLQVCALKKTDQQGAKAWLQGKLFVATLIETLLAVGQHFSPLGYFLPAEQTAALPVA